MSRRIEAIYMIDDSDDEAYLTAEFFRRQGVDAALRHRFTYTSLEDLAEDGQPFDPLSALLMVDLNLRSSRGTDVIRRIRADPAADGLIAGICTGSQDPADGRDALEAGSDFCIAKPLDRQALEKLCRIDDRLRIVNGFDEPLLIDRVDG